MSGIVERVAHWKAILFKPFLGALWSIYTALGLVTWIRDEMVKRNPGESAWHVVDFLPHWSAWKWLSGALLIAVVSALENSYRHADKATAGHRGEVGKLKKEVEELTEKLRDGPAVILSNVRTGIDLRVESIREDALNVRLVPAESRNYYVDSDVVRTLRMGTPETLVLHCHYKERGASLVHQAFAAPSLFFDDLLPAYEGTDTIGALEHARTILTERQLAVPIELAYSNLSSTQHYRSSFRVRWDAFRDSIIDVEPTGTRLDDEPPSTAPPDVIPRQFGELDFGEWHAGNRRNFPNIYGEGHPNWIAVLMTTG